jgi:hypothetical protein
MRNEKKDKSKGEKARNEQWEMGREAKGKGDIRG